jgi:hypothetical protein
MMHSAGMAMASPALRLCLPVTCRMYQALSGTDGPGRGLLVTLVQQGRLLCVPAKSEVALAPRLAL